MVRLTDCPDMTLDVYRGGKTTMQQQPSYKMDLNLSDCLGRVKLVLKQIFI